MLNILLCFYGISIKKFPKVNPVEALASTTIKSYSLLVSLNAFSGVLSYGFLAFCACSHRFLSSRRFSLCIWLDDGYLWPLAEKIFLSVLVVLRLNVRSSVGAVRLIHA